jgi:hypothetical protein
LNKLWLPALSGVGKTGWVNYNINWNELRVMKESEYRLLQFQQMRDFKSNDIQMKNVLLYLK